MNTALCPKAEYKFNNLPTIKYNNMKILVFDTETTGLNPQWNVILQLSYQIVDSDTWSSIKTVNHYFSWPEDKSRVSQDAIKVNGLTEEVLSGKQLSNRKAAFEELTLEKRRLKSDAFDPSALPRKTVFERRTPNEKRICPRRFSWTDGDKNAYSLPRPFPAGWVSPKNFLGRAAYTSHISAWFLRRQARFPRFSDPG